MSQSSHSAAPASTFAAPASASAPAPAASPTQDYIRQLFRAYVRQFRDGCGTPNCPTSNCASNLAFAPLGSQQAATTALDCIKQHGAKQLCPNMPPLSVAAPAHVSAAPASSASSSSTTSSPSPSIASTASSPSSVVLSGASPSPSPLPARHPALSSSVSAPPTAPASSTASGAAMELSTPDSSPTATTRTLSASDPTSTSTSTSASAVSFKPAVSSIQYSDILSLYNAATAQQQSASPSPSLTSTPFSPLIRLIGQLFADLPSLAASFTEYDSQHRLIPPSTSDPAFDAQQVDNTYQLLCNQPALLSPLVNAIRRCVSAIVTPPHSLSDLRALLILMECPAWQDPEHADVFRMLCKAVGSVRGEGRDVLVNWYTGCSSERLEHSLGVLQQYITVRWYNMSRIDEVSVAVLVMELLYKANERHRQEGLPHQPLTAFYNDAVNSELDLKADYKHWKLLSSAASSPPAFSFASHPFVLDPGSKARLLQIDAAYSMHREFQSAYIASFFSRTSPYLVLRVNRSNLIQDTLQQLSRYQPESYHKPLKVQFVGEQGIDEGGVRKEFFQLLVKELFDVNYGMFTVDDETRVYQLNPLSLESSIEFELIGIVLGLALYNSIILDIRFPLFIYKKLLNQPTTFSDLTAAHPALAKGLKALVDDATEQVEEVYARQFTVDIERYGERQVVELKPGGADIALTSANRHEYVQLYTDYVLNISIEKQFTAFKKGFDRCVPASLLVLFQPEELELLICGSDMFDWQQLKESARYDDGYTDDSNIIRWFWQCVDEWDEPRKRKLLMFCTGSDRAPIRGLGTLRLTISKNGGDSELLPTSHTCFNHLLLPEYGSREKLKRLLELALDNATGFGLI